MENQNIPEDVNATIEKRKQEVAVYNQKKDGIKNLLTRYNQEITNALPSFMNPKAVIQAIITTMMKKPELMDCTQHSIISCALTASNLGLIFDDILGEAYMIAFNNSKKGIKEAQFIPGYKGLCTLARRSGQVKSIKSVPVHEGDFFEYEEGLDDYLRYKSLVEPDVTKITHVFSIIKYLNGGYEFKVMTHKQIIAVRDKSKNYIFAKNKAETIWHKDFEEMAKKTVLRRLLKTAPLSPDLAKAVAIDEAAEIGKQNLSVEWANQMPEFSEDIDHEIIEEEIQNQDEMNQERQEENTTIRNEKATAATNKTQQILEQKAAAAAKKQTVNQKIQPK